MIRYFGYALFIVGAMLLPISIINSVTSFTMVAPFQMIGTIGCIIFGYKLIEDERNINKRNTLG